jgi:YgiT-type zinc finger domain-containing protein
MKCVICKTGETHAGLARMTLHRGECMVIIKNVPAEICDNCGEYYLSGEMTDHVYQLADQAFSHGAELEILSYAA